MAAGSIVISLLLASGAFETDTDRARKKLEAFGKSVDKGVSLALGAATVAAGAAVVAFQNLTNEAAKFKDLEESTGASAESIASLAVSAATAGIDIETVATSMNKLTKSLVGVDDESKAAGAALAAIGLNVKDFKQLDPAAQYEAIGKALSGYAEAGKVAVAQALFGTRAGAEQLRVFKALEESGGRQVILTQAQIDRADAYADAQAKATTQLRLYAQAAATEAIPAVTALTGALTDVIKEVIGVDAATGSMKTNAAIRDWAFEAAKGVAILIEALTGLAKTAHAVGGSFQSVTADVQFFGKVAQAISAPGSVSFDELKESFANRQKVAAEANQRYIDLWTYDGTRISDAIRKAQRAAEFGLTGFRNDAFTDPRSSLFGKKPSSEKPALAFNFDSGAASKASAAASKAATEAQKVYDEIIKAERDFAEQQKATFDYANRLLESAFDQGLTSLSTYHAQQQAIRDAALQASLRAADAEIAERRAESTDRRLDPTQRLEASRNLAEAERKRSETVVESARQNELAYQAEGRQFAQFATSLIEFQAQIAEAAGDSQLAVSLRIAKQVGEAQKVIAALGADPALAEGLRKSLQQSEDLKQIQTDSQLVVRGLAVEEERLAIARQNGHLSELGMLQKVGVEREKAIVQLEGIVAALNAMAAASPKSSALALQAAEATVALERLRAEADPLAAKFGNMFEESFGNAFGDFITQTKTAKEAFRSFIADVANQLLRMAAQDIAASIFGGSGQSSSSGGSWIGAAASAFASWWGGGKASGGAMKPNTAYAFAENGPEVFSDGRNTVLVTGPNGGRADPDPRGGKSVVNNNYFTINVPGSTDRRSASQFAADASRQLAANSARNN